MSSVTINFPLNNFKITEIKEFNYQIQIYGETTETSVDCHTCDQATRDFHGYDEERRVEHLPAFGKTVYVFYKPKRYICKKCNPDGTTTTATPKWHTAKSGFTEHYEARIILDLICSTAKDVAMKNGFTEKEVQGIIDRHVESKADWDTFETLDVLGIDDLSSKKGYRDFISVITSRVHQEIRLLGIVKGRKKRDIKAFFKSIPKHLRKTVTAVCCDMYAGYINAAKAVFKKAVSIIIDRFHVAKLYRASVDKFRQQILKELKQNLSIEDKEKLSVVFSNSYELSEAYRLALELTHIFNTHQTKKSFRKICAMDFRCAQNKVKVL